MLCLVLPVAMTFHVGSATMSCARPIVSSQASPRLAADHPAVVGWPDKYTGTPGGPGPRILHDTFAVEAADHAKLIELDAELADVDHGWQREVDPERDEEG